MEGNTMKIAAQELDGQRAQWRMSPDHAIDAQPTVLGMFFADGPLGGANVQPWLQLLHECKVAAGGDGGTPAAEQPTLGCMHQLVSRKETATIDGQCQASHAGCCEKGLQPATDLPDELAESQRRLTQNGHIIATVEEQLTGQLEMWSLLLLLPIPAKEGGAVDWTHPIRLIALHWRQPLQFYGQILPLHPAIWEIRLGRTQIRWQAKRARQSRQSTAKKIERVLVEDLALVAPAQLQHVELQPSADQPMRAYAPPLQLLQHQMHVVASL